MRIFRFPAKTLPLILFKIPERLMSSNFRKDAGMLVDGGDESVLLAIG